MKFIIRRLVLTVLTLWVVFTISFALKRGVPGGPFSAEKKIPEFIKRNIEKRYRMDQPLHVQYAEELWHTICLDFGPSLKLEDFTVNEILAAGFPVSASLGIFALFFALTLGLVAGTLSAVNRNSLVDVSLMSVATVGIAVPNFVLASLCVVVFVFWLQLLPTGGWGTLRQIVLPALCLGAPFAAYVARLTRAGVLEVLHLDYVRTAYAKGMLAKDVIIKHVMKGAILPVVTYIGPATAGILTGSLVLERVFNIPGLGSHLVDSATQRDYPLTTGLVMTYTFLLCLMNLLVDISYAMIDPRVKAD